MGRHQKTTREKQRATEMPEPPQLLSYEALDAAAVETVEKAFAKNGLGFLVVENVPGFVEARRRLLPLVRRFAKLPESVRNKYVREDLRFQFGWSHGKEVLENGNLDEAKGSFYANPFEPAEGYNVWPSEVAELEAAFKEMSQIMRGTAIKLGALCDAFLERERVSAPSMRETISNSVAAKGRLLYYFPQTAPKSSSDAKWCGWHCDHGSLTCLTKAMYFDEDGTEVTADVGDDLAIEASDGTIVNVRIPAHAIAFQIGQAAQIQSGALLRATPHCVTYPPHTNVSRCTFALFLQPDVDEELAVPPQVVAPVLPTTFRPGMTFGGFTKATVEKTYSAPAPKL